MGMLSTLPSAFSSGLASLLVMFAIYTALTIRDPMAKRVKALNERREQLKAGIVASTNKRKKLTNKNEAADKVRSILGHPAIVELVPPRTLPRTSSGKLSRAKAKRLYLAGEIQPIELSEAA